MCYAGPKGVMCADPQFHAADVVRRMRAVPLKDIPERIPLEPVDRLTITTLVDNSTDALLEDQGPAKRAAAGRLPHVEARLMDDRRVRDALQAEHGFSALVEVSRAGKDHRVLFDAGLTPSGMVNNMRRLGIDPK